VLGKGKEKVVDAEDSFSSRSTELQKGDKPTLTATLRKKGCL
jgi:hypothetical protein